MAAGQPAGGQSRAAALQRLRAGQGQPLAPCPAAALWTAAPEGGARRLRRRGAAVPLAAGCGAAREAAGASQVRRRGEEQRAGQVATGAAGGG